LLPLTVLAWVLVAGSTIGCAYLCFACLAVRRFVRRPRLRAASSPAVTLLKPLCGDDPGLGDNLRSFCRQDYPAWQLVCGVQAEGDPAVATVRRLIAEFPAAEIALVVDSRRSGGNLKVANLRNMLPAARHPWLVMSDSDMRVTPDYLAQVTAPLHDPAVGLVTCLYRGVAADGLWSALACLHVNHGFLPQAVVGEALRAGAGCFGASIALRRETLEAIGGFAAIADALADDHAMGAAVRRLGRRIELSPCLIDNHIAEPGLTALFRHELRWARTIRLVAPAGFLGSIVTHPVALAALATALGVLPAAAPAMLGASLVCRFATAALVDRALALPPSPLWLLPVRDLLSFAVFLASFFGRTVAWRDRTFRIGPDGQLSPDGDKPA
jgi:ceramide glucosyltransferase